ncbi:MAG: hypothetical protein ACXWCG_01635 [Flavitalea sp.]
MQDASYTALQNFLHAEFQLMLAHGEEDLQQKLASKINDLIQKDFSSLINILYRIDVDEIKLKQALESSPNEDAGDIIAKIIIDRQMQKIRLRKPFTKKADSDNEEKW